MSSSSPKSPHKNTRNHLALQKTPDVSFSPRPDPNGEGDDSNAAIVADPAQFDTSSCPHLSELRFKLGPNPFLSLRECLRVRPLGRTSIRREPPHELVQCGVCSRASARMFACIACAAVFCQAHAQSHAAELDGAHVIAVDVDRGELFCSACKDQVYDADFDAAVVLAHSAAAAMGAIHSPPLPPPAAGENLRKRRRVEYMPWTPDPSERVLIVEKSIPIPAPELPRGLRGLNNLGSTCFMSSVLQAFLHTPPLRNYFLSDKHNRYLCQQRNSTSSNTNANSNIRCKDTKKGGNKGKVDPAKLCLACDFDALFSAMFSGDRTPYSPAKLLHSWWHHASNLASYQQQDAHEFFISMLDGIHEKLHPMLDEVHEKLHPMLDEVHEKLHPMLDGVREKLQEDRLKLQNQGSGDCCIAHRVFSGILRSDVMCSVCGFTSTTYDPFVDISLDLEQQSGGASGSAKSKTTKKSKLSSFPGEAAGSKNSSQNSGFSTLMGCLDRFTRPEKLGTDQKFFCQQCKVSQESLKQMSIRKLPLVSCFHIKRFEHSHIKKMSRKIDRYLQFPFSLNMAPYLSSSILRRRFGDRVFPFDSEEDSVDPSSSEASSEFELFAVITHAGKLDAGHYVTYLRLSNQWYKCDDAWITRVNDNVVRAAQGYMIFYVQKMLYYKVSDRQEVCPEK